MMRLSLLSGHFNREIQAGTETLFSFIDYARSLDVDAVDFNVFTIQREDKDFLREVKLRCLRNGLSIACVSAGPNLGAPEAEVREQIDTAKRWIDHAQFLGAPQVRIWAGWPARGDTVESAWPRAARGLKEVADYGYERGVLASIQNHNHAGFTRTGSDILRFVQDAGPHLGHVLDTGQYVGSPGAGVKEEEKHPATGSLYESIQQTVHLATHVRTKFYRIDSGVEEWLDYPRIFSILRAARYNGYLSVAYEGTSPHREAVPKAVSYLRSLMD